MASPKSGMGAGQGSGTLAHGDLSQLTAQVTRGGTLAHGDLSHLTSQVDEGLLRGVRVHKVLHCLGSIWEERSASRPEDQDRDFALSEPVARIDDFITHDWASGRWGKFIALCYVYNARATTLATMAASLALLACVVSDLIPMYVQVQTPVHIAGRAIIVQKPTFLPVGFAVALLTFVCWQSVFGVVCCCPRTVFVDKVCIQQSDAEVKRRGILSLAGFVGNSNRMVLLWTPRYFTRLWCLFEVATWLRTFGCDGICFMPVSKAAGASIIQLSLFLYFTIQAIAFAQGFSFAAMTLPCIFVSSVFFTFGSQKPFRDFSSLPRQLGAFSIRESACFCCSNSHVLPSTGQNLPCDRTLIYATLKSWFEEEAAIRDDEDPVEQVLCYFDALVQVEVQRSIVARMGVVRLDYGDAMFMALPFIINGCEELATIPQLPTEVRGRQVLFSFAIALLWSPTWIKLTRIFTGGVSEMNRRWGIEPLLERRLGREGFKLAVALLWSAFWSAFTVVLYAPMHIARTASSQVPMWCCLGVFAWLTFILFVDRPGPSREDAQDRVQAEVSRRRSAGNASGAGSVRGGTSAGAVGSSLAAGASFPTSQVELSGGLLR